MSVRLQPAQRYQIQLDEYQPAQIDYELIAFQTPQREQALWQKQAMHWRQQGFVVRSRQIGTVFAINGQLIDNRARLGVLNAYPDAASARLAATQLATRTQQPIRIYKALKRRPSAKMTLRIETGTIWARDLIELHPHRQTIHIEQVEHGRGYRWHGHQNRNYHGLILITPDRYGTLAAINRLPLPALLRGLLPAEMPPNAPMEALKAQAVCARNEILAKIGTRHHADPYLFCAETHCQVYAGADAAKQRTDQALRETHGQILMQSANHLADAPYSAICGGHTEHNENVWHTPKNAGLRGKADLSESSPRYARGIDAQNIASWLRHPPAAYCQGQHPQTRKRFRWRRVFRAHQLDRMLNRHYPLGSIRRLKVIKRGISGRVHALQIVAKQRELDIHGELHIRKLFGGLLSSMFVIKRIPQHMLNPRAWLFLGGGWGHGVGLCQRGAIGRARSGQSYRRILQHYFSGTSLRRIY